MKLKASYTVEAAVVISISFILFAMAVILSYEIFKAVVEYVTYEENSFDAVSVFRLKEAAMGVIHAIKE